MERIGDLLVKKNIISHEQLQKALEEQRSKGGRVGSNLIKLGYIQENELVNFLSEQFGVPSINLSEFEISPEVIDIIPEDIARRYLVIPVSRNGPTLTIAMADPSNIFAIDDIKFLTGYNIEVVVASEISIIEAIKKYYGKDRDYSESILTVKDYSQEEEEEPSSFPFEDNVKDVDDIDSLVQGAIEDIEVVKEKEEEEEVVREVEAPIIKLVNSILIKGIKLKVSDIHIEPYEKTFRIRYRIDGVLKTAMNLPLKIKNAIISRVKIMANLDIAERRLPQDGRIKMKIGKGKEMDFRVSVIPTLFGEKVVLRLLDKSTLQLDMTKLGFEEEALAEFKEAIHKPYGMVLVTGPTGSGKTTTLYSALAELNRESDNIMTAEDPVEFNFMGINQVQMHEEIGLNFATALRSFLRQDPDIILVGEIRDFETAEISIKAALTGHLVLSTLHTNDAPSTITRLLNMGIEPFLVSSSLNLIVAQRLVRKICTGCKEKIKVLPQALIDMGASPDEAKKIVCYKGAGCPECGHTGYKGRIALYEVLPVKEEIKELILTGASALEIKREAIRLGMKTLRRAGITKIKEGITTMEEVIRVTASD
jgi:type IV pilus assembly protein PilB